MTAMPAPVREQRSLRKDVSAPSCLERAVKPLIDLVANAVTADACGLKSLGDAGLAARVFRADATFPPPEPPPPLVPTVAPEPMPADPAGHYGSNSQTPAASDVDPDETRDFSDDGSDFG